MHDVPAPGAVVGALDGDELVFLVVLVLDPAARARPHPRRRSWRRARRRLGLGRRRRRPPRCRSVFVAPRRARPGSVATASVTSGGASASPSSSVWSWSSRSLMGGILREEKRDQLPEGQVEHEDQDDHEDQGGQHDGRVVDELGAVGQATWRISSRTSRRNCRRGTPAVRCTTPLLPRRLGRPHPRARVRVGRRPIGLHLPLALHHALGLAVHGSRLTLLRLGSVDVRAGQEGLEPPTTGFGDRCSTS